jgi:hypothetical protein
MSFALTASLITQSGTDANLSGLAGIAGVTTKVEGAGGYIKTRYYVPAGVSITYSTLTFDPRYESLHFGNTACLLYPASGSSVLTIGAQITQYSGTYANMSEAITFGDNSGNAYIQTSGLRINTGALFWYSGIIRVQTCTGLGSISPNNGGTATGTLTGYIGPNAVLEVMQVPAGQTNESCQIHVAGAVGFQVDGLTVRAYGSTPPSGLISMCTSTAYTNPPVFKMEGFGGITPQSDARQSTFSTFYGLSLKACKKGLNWYFGSLIRGINCAAGSGVTLVEHNVDPSHTQGYAEIRGEVDVTCKNSSGALVQDVRVYVKDTNNGDRQTYTAFSQNINNTADKTYFGSTDVDGNLKWLGNSASILLCAVVRLTTGTVVGIDDSGLNKKDIRSLTNVKGTDDFRFHYWGYSIQYLSSIEIVQSDKVAYKIAQAFLTDTNVTLTKTAAEAKLASSFSITTPTITLTAASTLDDVYDAMKAWKTAAVVTQVEYPTIATQPVDGVGTALTTAMNLVLNAIALTPGTKFKTIAAATLSSEFSVGGAYSYVAGTLTAPASAPTFTGGTANIGAAATYAFNTVGAIVSMTPSASSTYTFTGAHTATVSLKNTSAFAITVQLPLGTAFTTAANIGGTITVTNPAISLQVLRPNIINGSNFVVRNTTQSTEIASGTVSGGAGINVTFTKGTHYNANDVLTILIGYCVGTSAKFAITEQITSPTLDAVNSAPTTQVAYDVYNSMAINGSAVTGFTADYAQFDVNVTLGADFLGQNFMAWWVYNESTLNGLRNFVGLYTLIDEGNIRNNTAMQLVLFDNTTTTDIKQIDNVRIFRADAGYPVKMPSTGGGSIDINWRNAVVVTGLGTVVADTALATRIQMDTNSTKLDVAVSTRLATAGYTAPNNAGIAAIPTNPLLTNDTRLNNLDAAVSTRLATAGYTVPPTVAAIRTEIDANSTKLDVAVSTRDSTTNANANAAAAPALVWAVTSESAQAYGKQLRDMRAALLGKTTGGGTATETFLAADGATSRVVSTNDGTNRTNVSVPGA